MNLRKRDKSPKRKSKKNSLKIRANSTVSTNGKVSFKKKKTFKARDKIKKRKPNKHSKRKNSRKTKSLLKKASNLFIIFFSLLLLIGLIYISIIKILEIRKTRFNSELDLNKMVYAIDNVPQYPGSEFIYKNLLNNETVKKTLSSGISAYRLPPYKQIDDVYKFYTDHLPDFGWTYIQTVPLASPTMYSGQYWVNTTGGLRIYTRLNDIWYEKVTKEEAKNGLELRQTEVLEREEVLAQDEDQFLLPGFAWQLQLSSEYILDYFSTKYDDAIGVKMKHIVTSQVTILSPIGVSGKAPEDIQIENYLKEYNSSHEDKTWEIVNSMYTKKGKIDTLQVSLINKEKTTTAYVINNGLDENAYILVSFDNDIDFVEYVLANLIDKSTLTVNTDLKIYD